MKRPPPAPRGSTGDVNMLWSEISAGRMTASEAMELLRKYYDVPTEKPEPTHH
jgi:hypothetical protein